MKKSEINEDYDIIVIGAGGSGLSAGMYAGRLGLNVLVLGHSSGTELPIGGVISTTDRVENYPGFIRIHGMDLAKKIKEHAESYDEVTIKNEEVIEVEKKKDCFDVKTAKKKYKAKAIIFATGTKWRKLPKEIKGSREFEGKGINYCALCDAPLYKGKTVAVVGGSDTAAKDSLVLAKHAKKVFIIYRGDKIHPEPINMERVENSDKIEIINNTNIKEIKGDEKLKEVVLDKTYKGSKTLKLDGLFVAIGHIILSDLAKSIGVDVNKKGEIKINHQNTETNVKGVYASGDVTNKDFKQLIMGVADGCTAAYHAYEYITKKEIKTCSDQ